MKHSQLWLLALLSVLTFMTASSVIAAEDAGRVSGSWELGMSGVSIDDNAARVNEYTSVRNDDGVALAPKLDLEFKNGGFLLEAKS
ncbi:MAG: GSU2204 family outer membrane beta-barrel protein, partial [Desulfuromonadaceae bacterium]